MDVYSTEENFKQPVLQYNSQSKLFRLVEDYTLEWGEPDFRQRLFMKAGFEYDKASVPRFAWGFFRPDGPWEASALFHDRFWRDKGQFLNTDSFRYEVLINGEWQLDASSWTRKETDELLQEVGVMGGAKKWTAWLYKKAVQIYPPSWFKF